MLRFGNRAKMTVSGTPGTGALTLSTAVGGYQSFAAAGVQDGDVVPYVIEDGASWEFGYGLYAAAGGTLTRVAIMGSSNSGAAITASSAALVFIDALASDVSRPGASVIHNNRCDINQRGQTSYTVTTAGAYTVDGFYILPTGGSVTVTIDASRGNSSKAKAIKITGAAGVTDVKIIRRVESIYAADLAGQNCTAPISIYNGTGASITPTFTVAHASTTDTFTSVAQDGGDPNGVSLQPCASSQWTDCAYTFTAGTNASNGMQLTFDVGALGAGSYVMVTAVDLRPTPLLPVGICYVPQPIEKRGIAVDLAFCQRYLETIPYDSFGVCLFFQQLDPASDGAATWHFKQVKRTANPAISLLSGTLASGGNWRVSTHMASYGVIALNGNNAQLATGTAGNMAFAASSELL